MSGCPGSDGPTVELAGSAELQARWDTLPLAYTVLGIDRIDDGAPAPTTLDSSAVGAALTARTTAGRFLVVATPQRDHPYNLARRVVSLAHLSRGRSGVLFGVRDAYAPAGPAFAGAWGGAGLGTGAPLTRATALEAARAVRALERSWPYDSVIGDRGSGILVRSERIEHVDLDGAYTIAGPLNAPEAPTGASVIAWYADGSDLGSAAPAPVDLAIGGRRLAVVGPDDEPPSDAVGVLLRAPSGISFDEILMRSEQLLAERFAPTKRGPLRAALGLPLPARPGGGRPAFAVPQPLHRQEES